MQKSLLKQDSQLSILHPGGERRRRRRKTDQGWSGSLIWSWLKAEGFGEGGSWKDYCTFSHPQQKPVMPLWFASLWGPENVSESLFCLSVFSFIFLLLFRKPTVSKLRYKNRHVGLKVLQRQCFSPRQNSGVSSAVTIPPHCWTTNSVTLAEKCKAMCHPTLQIACKAGPNYDQTTRATRRPTWLDGTSLSCLIYDTSQRPYCPIIRQYQGTTFHLLQHIPGRVSSASLVVSRRATQPLISACALA